jgi:hypothetical protein
MVYYNRDLFARIGSDGKNPGGSRKIKPLLKWAMSKNTTRNRPNLFHLKIDPSKPPKKLAAGVELHGVLLHP